MMGPTLGTGVRTEELGELPEQEGGQSRPRLSPLHQLLVLSGNQASSCPCVCIHVCVQVYMHEWAHTTRPWPLQSQAWPPFPVWSRTRPPKGAQSRTAKLPGVWQLG